MDEKRQFFRVKNHGDIKASYEKHPLDVIEISSVGVAIIKEDNQIPKEGLLDLNIFNHSLTVKFDLLKVEKKTMVLIFSIANDINKLFEILKQIKDEHKLS